MRWDDEIVQRFAVLVLYFNWNMTASVDLESHECNWRNDIIRSCTSDNEITRIDGDRLGLLGSIPDEMSESRSM